MATGRMLNKSTSTDPEFNQMSTDARELFLRTIPHLDRDGLVIGHPARLWAMIDPFHADRLARMGEYIQEWIDAGLVLRYDTGKEQILFFTGFRKNNPGLRYDREAKSAFPPPPGWRRTRAGLIPDNPDLRLALAQQYEPNSDYYRTLMGSDQPYAALNRSDAGADPELLPPEDQDQDQVVVVDQTNDHRNLVCVKGGVQGGEPTHLLQLPREALTEAARQYGPLIFGGDWLGDYEEFITTANEAELVVLVEWLYHLSTSTYESYETIKNLPAFVRKCVKNGSRPSLTTPRRQDMFKRVMSIYNRDRENGDWEP